MQRENHAHLHCATTDLTALKDFASMRNLTVHHEGDSWEDWGEKPLPGEAQHVIIEAEIGEAWSLPELLSAGADLIGQVELIPMQREQQRGILVSITSAEDWSREFFHIKQRERFSIDDI